MPLNRGVDPSGFAVRSLVAAFAVLIAATGIARAGQPSIYQDGSPVIDITGYKTKVVLNFRDKKESAPTDHSAADASSAQLGLIALGVFDSVPLSQAFDKMWNATKNKNGQTMRELANAQAIQQITAGGGSHVTGGFAQTGHLLALASPSGGSLLLSYWLPSTTFTFNEGPAGASWTLTFDTELLISVALGAWPNVPTPTGSVNLSNANVSHANPGAILDEALEQVGDLFSTSNSGMLGDWPANLFAGQEAQVDSTVSPTLDITSIGGLLNSLAQQATPLGFVKCVSFVGATQAGTVGTPAPTLNIRLVHPVDPGPGLINTAIRTGLQLLPAAISPSQTQVPVGGSLVLTGRNFPAAQAEAIYVGWMDTVSGTLTSAEVKWSAADQPAKTVDISRKPNDSLFRHTISGLNPATSYRIQVRDADQLTNTDWGAPLTVKTALTNDVIASLQVGNNKTLPVGVGMLDAAGTFTSNVTVPAVTSTGEHTLTAVADSVSASISIKVLGSGQLPTPTLFVVNPTMGTVMGAPVTMSPSAAFTLHGEGFKPGTVTLAIQGGKSLGDASAAANGTFALNVSAPALNSGSYVIVASQGSGSAQVQATLRFEVTPPPT